MEWNVNTTPCIASLTLFLLSIASSPRLSFVRFFENVPFCVQWNLYSSECFSTILCIQLLFDLKNYLHFPSWTGEPESGISIEMNFVLFNEARNTQYSFTVRTDRWSIANWRLQRLRPVVRRPHGTWLHIRKAALHAHRVTVWCIRYENDAYAWAACVRR